VTCEYGSSQDCFRELPCQRGQFAGEEYDALGPERAADPCESDGKLFFEELLRGGRRGVGFQGAFQNMSEEQATLLELCENGVRGLPCPGDLQGVQEVGGFAFVIIVRRIKKGGISGGRNAAEEEGLDVDGAVAGGPFEALEATREVIGRGGLAAAVAGERNRG